MKFKELKTMGSQESRIYRSLWNLMMFGSPFNKAKGFYSKFGTMDKLSDEIAELDIKDIFDMYSEKEIMNARGFGAKSMARLKELA